MKAYVRWMTCRNYQVAHNLIGSDRKVPSPDDLISLDKGDIVKTLCMFILEVKNANGEDYTRDTLYDLIVMIQSFFKQNGRPLKFFEDDQFFHIKNTLDNQMKSLSKAGKISPREKAVPISVSEEEEMWKLGILGEDNPRKLVDTVLYLIGIHFALRAADEHKNLKAEGNFSIQYDKEVGLKYLYYKEGVSKCNQGGIASRGFQPKTGRAYQNVVNSDRCIVRLFEKYISLRPSHDPKCSSDFYLRPLIVPNGDVWYSCQGRGRHTLSEVIKKMCVKAGIGGRRSNHSCRSSSATRMYDAGADEQLICEKTGHRSVAVRSYKRTSNRQLRDVTDILYGNAKANEVKEEVKDEVPPKVTKVEPTCTVSTPPVDPQVENVNVKTECNNNSTSAVELTKGLVLNINVNIHK